MFDFDPVWSRHGHASLFRRRDTISLILIAARVSSRLPRYSGEYDGAVFQAMKAVEVAVREASGLSDLIGVALVRQAFRPEVGPLTDTTSEKGEQEARAALFAGAIGSFKNPHSHRDVNLNDATEAIMLANHLLRIVDGRRRN